MVAKANTKAAAGREALNGRPPAEAKSETKAQRREFVISPPKFEVVKVLIEGDAPYVQNRFSQKAIEKMRAAQSAGSVGKKGTKREPKDFEAAFEGAKHVSAEGWCGIPAPAFRAAAVSACRLCGFKMTLAKLAIFTLADGFDVVDGTPLVRITKGQARYVEHAVSNATGVADIRPRPMWDPGWQSVVAVRYDAEVFSATDVMNLLARIGGQVGIGEGRPDSKNSTGQGWGTFRIVKVIN